MLAAGLSCLSNCASQNSGGLPPLSNPGPAVAKEGTLANETLVRDASQAVRKIAGGNKKIVKFVVQQPVGKPSMKAWREIWVHDPDGTPKQYIMTFREDGRGSAGFEIKPM